MIDAWAGASVFPMGFDENALRDSSASEANLVTAKSEMVKAKAGRHSTFALNDGRKVAARRSEADVQFPIVVCFRTGLLGHAQRRRGQRAAEDRAGSAGRELGEATRSVGAAAQ